MKKEEILKRMVSLKLTESQFDFVKAIAKTEDISVSQVFRNSIDAHLKRN